MTRRDEIEDRLKAATSGPWDAHCFQVYMSGRHAVIVRMMRQADGGGDDA